MVIAPAHLIVRRVAVHTNVHTNVRALVVVLQGVSIEKLEDLYATAMDYGITLVTISHDPGTTVRPDPARSTYQYVTHARTHTHTHTHTQHTWISLHYDLT